LNTTPKPWPADTLDGARLILDALHGLLTGPGAVAYIKPGMDGSARLLAKEALDDAETIAAACMTRSHARRSDATSGDVHALFGQGPTLGRRSDG
jgi:hypothetical protein